MNSATAQQASGDAAPTAFKLGTAWLAVALSKAGIESWSDAAAAVAFIYTLCLLAEWLWKRCVRPFAVRRGWAKPLKRRREDRESRASE